MTTRTVSSKTLVGSGNIKHTMQRIVLAKVDQMLKKV